MSLTKCKECSEQISSSAKVCPHCGKDQSSTAKMGCAWVLVILGAIITFSYLMTRNGEQNFPAANPDGIANDTSIGHKSSDPDSVKSWIYHSSMDDMTGKPIISAKLESKNVVNFSFPYAGPQHATLVLRKHPRYGDDVIFMIERGQFGCNLDACSILVRFDEGKAEQYNAKEPEDHDTTAVFIVPASKFETHMRKAKTVRLESSFWQEGRRMFLFDVAGFDDSKLGDAPK